MTFFLKVCMISINKSTVLTVWFFSKTILLLLKKKRKKNSYPIYRQNDTSHLKFMYAWQSPLRLYKWVRILRMKYIEKFDIDLSFVFIETLRESVSMQKFGRVSIR